MPVAVLQQEEVAPGPDAADPHHAPSDVAEVVLLEGHPHVDVRGCAVSAVQGEHASGDLRVDGGHRGRSVGECEATRARVGGQAAHRPRSGASFGVRDRLGEQLARSAVVRTHRLTGSEVLEIAVDRVALGEPRDRPGVRPHGRGDGVVDDGRVAVVLGSRQDDADQQTFQIPLPGRPGGLVEIVEVEHERALRRGVEAEVRDVGVSARGDVDGGRGIAGEVGRHDRGSPAVEGERRSGHPLDPQGDEFGHAGRVLRVQDPERVAPLDGQGSEFTTRDVLTHLLPAGAALGGGGRRVPRDVGARCPGCSGVHALTIDPRISRVAGSRHPLPPPTSAAKLESTQLKFATDFQENT